MHQIYYKKIRKLRTNKYTEKLILVKRWNDTVVSSFSVVCRAHFIVISLKNKQSFMTGI